MTTKVTKLTCDDGDWFHFELVPPKKLSKTKESKLVKELLKFLSKHQLEPAQFLELSRKAKIEARLKELDLIEKKYGPDAITTLVGLGLEPVL